MAVQKKTNSGDKPEAKEINWIQVGIVGFCVLIVVMCILSFSNFSNFFSGNGNMGAVQAGYPVAVEYMMYINESPVFTSVGGFIAGVQVNESSYVPIDNSTKPYEIYASEQNQISNGVIGMSIGETKTVPGSGSFLVMPYTKDALANMSLSIDDMHVGDRLSLSFPYTDELGEEAEAVRTGIVTSVDSEQVNIQYGTDKIDIRFVGYLQASA